MKFSGGNFALAREVFREKRSSTLIWIVGGGLAMYFEALAIASELKDFPGGAQALAQSVRPTLEAMRIIRWPADRLDTLGGYLAYHNIVLVGFFLAVFAAIQGARLIRHLEDLHNLDYLLATGKTRNQILWMRSISFFLLVIVISLGLGLGTAFALWSVGEPDFFGSVITLLATGICVMPFFGLGLVLSQFLERSRIAAGIAVIVVTAIYAIGNISEKFPWLDWFKYLSPFYYANLSRPIIPGFYVNYWSWVLMVLVTGSLIWIASVLLQRRDIGSANSSILSSWHFRFTGLQRWPTPSKIVGHMLRRSLVGTFAWAVAVGSFIGVFIALMGGILEIWAQMSFLAQFTASGFGTTPEEQYLALTFEILPIFIAGYVVSQASTWTSDAAEGRVDLFLSAPIAAPQLVLERILAVLIGTSIIVVAAVLTVTIGTSVQGYAVDSLGLLRVVLMSLALALTLSSLCALMVRIFNKRSIVQILSIYIAAAWLITFMQPYLDWPEWILRLSIFHAFGHPYIEWPAMIDLLGIGSITVVCMAGALIPMRLIDSPRGMALR